ncbi:MAG: IS1 family transposase [Nostoc sp. NMS7]|nr:IS1 family transposase [Nostoc sp. NMS7]
MTYFCLSLDILYPLRSLRHSFYSWEWAGESATDINTCPQCRSTKLSRWGKDKRGIKQRFKCKDCGKIFVP